MGPEWDGEPQDPCGKPPHDHVPGLQWRKSRRCRLLRGRSLRQGFVLISQNRQSIFSNKRAELDYEVSVRTHRKIHEVEAKLDRLLAVLSERSSGESNRATKDSV